MVDLKKNKFILSWDQGKTKHNNNDKSWLQVKRQAPKIPKTILKDIAGVSKDKYGTRRLVREK